jgi:hypothetical protein
MKLLLAVVVISVLLGYVFGGRLHRLEALRPRWWGLVILGLAIQFIPLPEGASGTDLVIRTAVLSLSYTLLVAFALVNVRMPGMFLVVIGLACNFAVIAVNGQEDVLAYLQEEGHAQKHHLLTDEDQLTFLADVIPVPQPIGQAISVGDVFVYVGLIWLIVAVMRGWTPSARREGSRPRRGKHRRAATREPVVEPDFGFLPPGARTSGTGR